MSKHPWNVESVSADNKVVKKSAVGKTLETKRLDALEPRSS